MKLHLHVKTEYFNQVKAGTKRFEYRAYNEYWRKRLIGRDYEGIVYYNAYKHGADNRIEMPWRGVGIDTITHPHFGPEPRIVYCIPMAYSHPSPAKEG